jgi:hypothetical protein
VRGIGTIKLALAASSTTLQIALAPNLRPPSLPPSQVLELKILNADGRQTVGSTHFRLSSDGSSETIELESRYLDGQHDEEQDRVLSIDGKLRLLSYEHTFFGADGKAIMVDKFDAISRIATCSRREDGKMRLRSSQLDFSADMFCGATQLLIVTTNLRAGSRNINFHALACIPGPRVFHVVASVPEHTERWSNYPGDLIRLDLRPDLGAGINLIISPFLPKIDAWFDPHDNWRYVGGEFNRYFGGPHVYQVLVQPHR